MAAETFTSQVAIITGGAQGLGESVARILARNGCSVMIFDANVEKARVVAQALQVESGQSEGGRFEACCVDVSDEASVLAGFEVFRTKFNRLDIMVNCAGILGPNGLTEEIEVADFDRVWAVNTRGSFLMTKYSLLEMKKRNYGRILLIASMAGKEGNPNQVAYSTSKGAVMALAKSTGKEYAGTGITVNAIAPAVIKTAMVEAMDPAQRKYLIDKIPMKRCCTLEELASTVKFIVSPEASFNTGFCFDLSGGRATY